MMLPILSAASVACAALTSLTTLLNLQEYKAPPPSEETVDVSVIVPARDEEAGIAACVRSILRAGGRELELIVIDDASTDSTAERVHEIAVGDSRVKLVRGAPLPPGWNGKQHACWQGALAATMPVLCFVDADVRLQTDALSKMLGVLRRSGAALISGFPMQVTVSPLEKLLIPLIHFVLLGFLPMRLLRTTNQPGFAAGCGQFLMVRRDAYFAAGTHAAIRETMHDGLLLPRLLRRQGYATRLADMTELASCRMYHDARSTWNGLSKNATEGIAAPTRIVPFTLLLGFGQVLPVPLLAVALVRARTARGGLTPELRWSLAASGAAVGLSYLPRLLEVRRFRQRALGAALHPLAVGVLLTLQWYAFARKALGKPTQWKQRAYAR